MEVVEMLDNLKEKARRDPALREVLLATRKEKEPLAAFCKKCRELGVPVYGWSKEVKRIFAIEAGDLLDLVKIPRQYTSPALGTVHHRFSAPGCGIF